MATATKASSIFLKHYDLLSCSLFFFFVLSSFSSESYGYEGRETLEESHNLPNTHLVQLSSLFPSSSACKPNSDRGKQGKRSSLKVVHKDGPCSKLNQDKPNASPNLTQILLQDQSRVDSIHSRLYNSARDNLYDLAATIPVKSGKIVNSGNYVVTVGLGTPKADLTLVFDTGSGLTWTQCEPCAGSCHQQNDPIFAPSKSTSYANISCNSPVCSQLKSTTSNPPRCLNSACVYGIQYGDQSYSIGFLGKEKLTLGSTTDVFDNFYFGCGQENKGLFGGSAGLFGLAADELSFVSQTAQKYGKFFTYCLPSTVSSTGHLIFGKGDKISSMVKFTPLVKSSLPFYFINTIAISVGGTKLPISASVFSNAGMIIDSGTVITRLPPSAYMAMRSAFRQMMSKYPATGPIPLLDTCYDLSGYTTVSIPKISFFFDGGVEMVLTLPGIIYAASKSQVCLAFAANADDSKIAIFGNAQQLTYDIVHDVAGGMLGFGPGGCN